MAFCSNCGQELMAGAKFCSSCGKTTNGIELESKRKQIYEGEIHKCPNCGGILNSFNSVCSMCGYEVRGAKAVNSVQELAQKLEALEEKRVLDNSVGNIVGGFVKKIAGMDRLDPIDEQKITLIRNFPIPNTKEDIQEFIVLASSNMSIEPYGSKKEIEAQKALIAAWEVKYKQANQKAKMLFGFSFDTKGEKKQKGSGWASWSGIAKFGWVILNIYTLGIPAIIYYCVKKKD